jgi:hypothetical protein
MHVRIWLNTGEGGGIDDIDLGILAQFASNIESALKSMTINRKRRVVDKGRRETPLLHKRRCIKDSSTTSRVLESEATGRSQYY